MKLTKHNGRAGKDGVYNPKHNDRRFDLSHSEHIDAERARENIYWDCYGGLRRGGGPSEDEELAETFNEIERRYYDQHYGYYVLQQHFRNEKNRHPERNRSIDDLLSNKKTCPEETILQIGKMEEHVSADVLLEIAVEFMAEIERRFGKHVHILDWALHLDESTPHIHERHVFDCENQWGELCPQQEKALEILGFELPHPNARISRFNNRKMVYDAACRTLLFDICKKHGLQLDEEPEYGGRAYLEKQDFIREKQKAEIAAQKEQLATQEARIAQQSEQLSRQQDQIVEQAAALDKLQQKSGDLSMEVWEKGIELKDTSAQLFDTGAELRQKEEQIQALSVRLSDVEGLIADASETAYRKAVDVVAKAAVEEAQKENLRLLSRLRKEYNEPKGLFSGKLLRAVNELLDRAAERMRSAFGRILNSVRSRLLSDTAQEKGVRAVQQETRVSVREQLARAREMTNQQKKNSKTQSERWDPNAR